MLYEKIEDNPKKAFILLSCVIYTIIKIVSVFIIQLVNKKKLSEITMGYKEGYKDGDKSFNIILGIGIPIFLMNLMSCRG